MRYKGNYSAVVTIDFDLDANTEGLLPFDEIKEKLSQFTPMLKELIESEIDGEDEIHVHELNCEIHKEDDDVPLFGVGSG